MSRLGLVFGDRAASLLDELEGQDPDELLKEKGPQAMRALRYFFEELPELHVVAAGSLLDFVLGRLAEFPAARHAIDSFPLMDDPWWGEYSWQASFTRLWNARYGPGAPEDVKRKMTGIDYD